MFAPVAQLGECSTADPTGSGVRFEPRRALAICSCLLAWMARDRWQKWHYRPEEAGERGVPCSALRGMLNVRL